MMTEPEFDDEIGYFAAVAEAPTEVLRVLEAEAVERYVAGRKEQLGWWKAKLADWLGVWG